MHHLTSAEVHLDKELIISKVRNNKYLKDFLNKESLAQFKRYLITGFTSFGLEYGAFSLLFKVFMLWYVYANGIVYIVVFWFNFLMNRKWSFKSSMPLKQQLKRYTLLFVINLGAQSLFMYILSDFLGLSPLISKFFVTGAVVSWNFVLYKKIIYKT